MKITIDKHSLSRLFIFTSQLSDLPGYLVSGVSTMWNGVYADVDENALL